MKWTNCGIAAMSCYIPRYRFASATPANTWRLTTAGGNSRSVANSDEDATTMAIEAGRRLLEIQPKHQQQIDCVWVGSESKPYGVNSTASTVSSCLGFSEFVGAGDIEFACRAGVEAMLRLAPNIEQGSLRSAMVICADTGAGAPGDELETAAGAAAVGLILANAAESPVRISSSVSSVSDMQDFYRRETKEFPSHAGRFTGEPGYFAHVEKTCNRFFEIMTAKPSDFRFAVFHQPNEKFVRRVAQRLGFQSSQVAPFLFANRIGNPYTANVFLGLATAISQCDVGDQILVGSYGSGAGADCFAVQVTSDVKNWGCFDSTSPSETIENYADFLAMTNQLQRGGA